VNLHSPDFPFTVQDLLQHLTSLRSFGHKPLLYVPPALLQFAVVTQTPFPEEHLPLISAKAA